TPVLDDVEHVDMLGERRADRDAHQLSQPRRRRTLRIAQVSLADLPAVRGEHRADRAAGDDLGMLGADRTIQMRWITHDRERPAGLVLPGPAEEVRDADLPVLLEHLDAITAEGGRDPLAVQELPAGRLARGLPHQRERNGGY